jgi:heme/copper-type cytochrome/quinol oxidase subunit 2
MSYLRMFSRKAAVGLTLLVGWLATGPAWAVIVGKPPVKAVKEEDSGMTGSGAYVFAYMLFILGIVLGLMVVCRSANRRDRARPEDYVESALTEDTAPSRGKK